MTGFIRINEIHVYWRMNQSGQPEGFFRFFSFLSYPGQTTLSLITKLSGTKYISLCSFSLTDKAVCSPSIKVKHFLCTSLISSLQLGYKFKIYICI